MSECEIMDEIPSVFRKPMKENWLFLFEILQLSGYGSKCLSIPEVSSSYEWSAASVAGKNPKCPVSILALDKLKVTYKLTPSCYETPISNIIYAHIFLIAYCNIGEWSEHNHTYCSNYI